MCVEFLHNVQLIVINSLVYSVSLATAVLLFACNGFGQKLKVHAHAGIHASNSNADTDSVLTKGMMGGYNLGIDLRLGGYDSWVYFQPGAHFYQARLNIYSLEDFTEVENYQKAELQLSQLKVPLNLGFYVTGTDGLLRVRASAGLTPSMILQQSETKLRREDTEFSTFGVGVNAGLGIDLTILTIDLRYEHGSTRVFRSGNGNMNFLTLTAGFIIPPSL